MGQEISITIRAIDLATRDLEAVNKKVKQLGDELNRTEWERSASAIKRFNEALKSSLEPLANAAKLSLGLSSAMTAIAGAMVGKAFSAAVEYESAMSDLAKVLDGGAEEAKQYADALNEVALRYGESGQELLASMANFKQAGFSASEAFGLVEESLKLMIAGDVEAAAASESLVAILQGFAAPASEAGRAVDILNEVSNKYATSVGELAQGMADFSPIARQMGFSMEETAGLLTPIIEVFRSGSEAADALKTGMLRLTDDAKPVTDALKNLGDIQQHVNGKLRSGKDIFLDVARAMQGLTEKERLYYTQQLVGIDQAARMSVVFGELGKYLEVTESGLKATGSATSEVATRLQTAQKQIDIANESFRQLSVTLGNKFKEDIGGTIGAVGKLASAFNTALQGGAFELIFIAIGNQIESLNSLILTMAENLSAALAGVDFMPLASGLATLGAEIQQSLGVLFEGYDLTTVEGLRNLIQALTNVLGDLAHHAAGVVSGLKPLFATLNALFDVASSGNPMLARTAGEMSGLAVSATTVIPAILSVASAMMGFVGDAVVLIGKIALVVAGFKLLSAAGIPVVAILTGLAGKFLALSPAVAGVAAAMTGMSGAVVAMGAAVTALGVGAGMLLSKLVDLGAEALYAATGFDLFGTAAQEAAKDDLEESLGKRADKLAEISKETGVAVNSMAQLRQAVAEGRIVQDEATGAWSKGSAELQRLATMQKLAGDETAQAAGKATDSARALNEQMREASGQSLAVDVDASEIDAADEQIEGLNRDTGNQHTIDSNIEALEKRLEEIKQELETTHTISSNIEEIKQDADALSEPIEADAIVSSNAGEIEVDLDALGEDINTSIIAKADTSDAESAIRRLEKDTYSTHTVRVREVQAALGGLIGLAAGGSPMRRRRSRYIKGPGTETSDSIPALLSRGEYVIRAASVRKYGLGFLDRLNRGLLADIPRFATGGPVTNSLISAAPSAGQDLPEMAINLSVQGGQPMRLGSSRETARELATALRNLERGR